MSLFENTLITDTDRFLCSPATAVLVTASTEVDKTGASYYGEQTLHYLSGNGETSLVQLCEYQGFPFVPVCLV